MSDQQPPKELDAIVDLVLAYKPKGKTPLKERKGKKAKGSSAADPDKESEKKRRKNEN